jgi:D-alanine-D-alanine ligase
MAAGCTGISRIDFFIDKDNGDILLNEINTMPGFTEFSMYPQLWKNSGIPYSQLIDELIQFGIGKFNGVK